MKKNYFHEEEDFHGNERKHFRKERRLAQETDRSKFKKTDLDQAKAIIPSDDPRLRSGRVTAITGEGIWTDVEGVPFFCTLRGVFKKDKMHSKNLIAVGDLVRVLPSSEREGSIASIEKRYSFLSRTDQSGKNEQLLAVNIDQVLIVVSIESPPLKPALIDRYLIAAEKGNMQPIIVVNKLDLLDEASSTERELYQGVLIAYERLGIPMLSLSTKTNLGIDALRALMQHKASVFSGQSGVGKSSLLNAAFHFELRTGDLAQKTYKGTHTTTTAKLLSLPGGGFCIDTPGIRSFGVWGLEQADLVRQYREFTPYASHCRYPDCTHLVEPACKVREALEEKQISSIRFASYRSLLEEINGLDHRTKIEPPQ